MAYHFDTVKLEKGMYGETGRTFTQVLEAQDPSEQYKGTALEGLEKYITADIVCLMALIVYALVQALRYAAMNRALQHKVYVDGATGLPNKNKCEELLSDPEIPGGRGRVQL